MTSGDLLNVHILDEGKNPVPSAKFGGKAAMLGGDKPRVVALVPGDGNSLIGKLAPAGSGKMTAVLSLTVSGKPAQARFASAR